MLPSPLTLYHYWRSSSSWRVRWALEIKGIQCHYVPINLLDGESEGPEHKKRNPLGYVPVLELPDGKYLSESIAIIEWIEDLKSSPPLLPKDPYLKARSRQLAELINAGTQPLQNPTVVQLHSEDATKQKEWIQHWIRNGLGAYETLVRQTAGLFSFGDAPTLADLCLIPQCYSAGRFEVDLSNYPTISKIYSAALQAEACRASHPDRFKPSS